MIVLSQAQEAAVEHVIARCRERGGFQRTHVAYSGLTVCDPGHVANAIVIDGNRNTIQWWIDDSMEIQGIAEFDCEGNRLGRDRQLSEALLSKMLVEARNPENKLDWTKT